MTEVTGVTVDVEGAIRGFQRLSIGNFRILEAWELIDGGKEDPLDDDPVPAPGPEPIGSGGLRPNDCLRIGEDDDGPPPPVEGSEGFEDDDVLFVKLVSTFNDTPEPDPAFEERVWRGGVGNDPEAFLACPPPALGPAAAEAAALEFLTASAIR